MIDGIVCASTFERTEAFLDADDGRPVFLFVQTYRVHAPYEVSAETRAAHGARLGIHGSFEEWSDRRLALRLELEREGAREELRETVRTLQVLHIEEGETLFEEGHNGDALFAVVEGKIAIVKQGKLLTELGPGTVVTNGAASMRT